MKTSLQTPFTIHDGETHLIVTIPAVPAGYYSFCWYAFLNGLGGNGNNGQVQVGLGDIFTGQPGGPVSQVSSISTDQFVSLCPNGSNTGGLTVQTSNSTGATRIITPSTNPPLQNTQVLAQAGTLKLLTPGDVSIYVLSGNYNDPTDIQTITDLTLIVEPTVPTPTP
jgi:hypothetical protein